MELEKARATFKLAEQLELRGIDFARSFSIDEICREYNGVGPQFLPAAVRGAVTRILAVYEPAALIHDLRFGCSNGQDDAFNFANDEFHTNCKICARSKYGAINPKRYLAYLVIWFMNKYNCGSQGHRAWVEAYEKNNTTKEGTI